MINKTSISNTDKYPRDNFVLTCPVCALWLESDAYLRWRCITTRGIFTFFCPSAAQRASGITLRAHLR